MTAPRPAPLPTTGRRIVVYLGGPMRGYAQSNFPLFLRVADKLRDAGYDVFNPAEMDLLLGYKPELPPDHPEQPSDFTIESVLENDIGMVLDSVGIVLLPGWRASAGACLERHVAQATGRGVWEYHEPQGEDGPFELVPLRTDYMPVVQFNRDNDRQDGSKEAA